VLCPVIINKLCGRPQQYAPALCKLTFDLLTLKVVSESHVTWATSVPISVFLGLSVHDLGPMYATDRQTSSDVRRASSLNASALWARGIIMNDDFGVKMRLGIGCCSLQRKISLIPKCKLFRLSIKEENKLSGRGPHNIPRPATKSGLVIDSSKPRPHWLGETRREA